MLAGNPNVRKSAFLRLLTLSLLTVQNTALVLLVKYSYRTSAQTYSASSVIACSEVVKFLLSGVLLMKLNGQGQAGLCSALNEISKDGIQLAVPSILYVVQNKLLFHAVQLLDPVVYIVCSQSKILWSALFGALLLKTRITRRQLGGLILLMYGMTLVQSQGSSRSRLPILADDGGSGKGILFVLLAGLTSGLAGAQLEKIYKRSSHGLQYHSLWFRNVQLAFVSIPLAVLSLFIDERQSLGYFNMFSGFDIVVIGVICLQAAGGLIIASVMQYATNVLKCFAVSISVCNCALISTLTSKEGDHLTMNRLCGSVLVITSTFIYGAK